MLDASHNIWIRGMGRIAATQMKEISKIQVIALK